MNILFLCAANVGRSQIAEGFGKKIFPDQVKVKSAALYEDRRIKYGGVPADVAITGMLEKSIDISNQKILLLDAELCNTADYIISFTELKESISSDFLVEGIHPVNFLYKYHSEKIKTCLAPDPYGEGQKYFNTIRDEIEKIILNLNLCEGDVNT